VPERRQGEPLNKFIGKFMADKHDKKKWPNPKQRLAVGYSEAKERAKKRG
jgi:hypothetical protein